MRFENTWHEIRDHSFIQNHSRPLYSQLHDGASSLQFTHSFFLQGSGQMTGMAIAEAWFCAQWPILCCFFRFVFGLLYGWKISNRVCHLWIYYLLVFDRIHDVMCLNKMSRTFSRNIGPQHKKYSSIFHCTHGALFIPVFTKPILSVCC